MIKFVLSLLVLAVPFGSAFFIHSKPLRLDTRCFVAAGYPSGMTYFEDLVQAVKAATHFGMCDSDKLHELADKVEQGADTCVFEVETDQELCQKEIDDRIDVAQVLRLQAELQLRMEAIEGSSLFAGDILDEDAIRQRDDLLDLLSEDSI